MEEILLNSLKVKKLFFSERVESREFFFIKIKGNGICEKLQKNMKAHYFSCQNSFTLQNSIMRFVKKSKVNNRSLYDPDFAIQKCIFCRVNFFWGREKGSNKYRQVAFSENSREYLIRSKYMCYLQRDRCNVIFYQLFLS